MLERKTILIVEDKKEWVDALKTWLSKLVRTRKLDCDIEIATNSVETFAKLAEHEQHETPLLLVCDNHLQESNQELLIVSLIDTEWRDHPTKWRHQTPIVIFSVTNPKREAKRLHAILVDKYPQVGDMGLDELEDAIMNGLSRL